MSPHKPMSRTNKTQQKKKALLEALEKSLGVVTSACKIVGVDRTTFYTYVNEDVDFKRAVDDVENIALDFAESQLHKQIQNGEVSSTIFFLKTKGKKHGYVEKQEVEHSGNMVFDILLPTPDEVDNDGEQNA
jgi:hypothetical protein